MIGEGRPVRDLELPIKVRGEDHWWRISCRTMTATSRAAKALRGAATDITSEKAANDQIDRLAHYDNLTGLPNRASFNRSMERALTRLDDGESLALLYVDVDRFKAINDTMGHSAGDRVLQAVGSRQGLCAIECRRAQCLDRHQHRHRAVPRSGRYRRGSAAARRYRAVPVQGKRARAADGVPARDAASAAGPQGDGAGPADRAQVQAI